MTPAMHKIRRDARIPELQAYYTGWFSKSQKYVTRPVMVNGRRYDSVGDAAMATGHKEATIRKVCTGETSGSATGIIARFIP